MEALSISEGRKRLFELREQIVSDHDQVILMRKGGNVVLISMDEWETNKETQRLLRDKEALKALIQSFDDHDSGKKTRSIGKRGFFGLNMNWKITILQKTEKDLKWFREHHRSYYVKCFDLV